jgi:lysozyme family protein
MKCNFDKSLALMLASEGGYVDHPQDPGGMTNLGVTRRSREQWVGRRVSEAEMRELTPASVAPMYKSKYWNSVAGDDLPSGVDYAVFDAAVNSGPGQASKWLQRAVGAVADGAVGPKTLAAVAAMGPEEVLEKLNKQRMVFLQELSTFPTFGKGWTNRVSKVGSEALAMVG